MKIQYWIISILCFLTILYGLRILYKEMKEGMKETPDEALYWLRNFVQEFTVNHYSAKVIEAVIFEYRGNDRYNQKFLLSIERDFQERFKELAETDEHSPENLDTEIDKVMEKQALRRKLHTIEISSDLYKKRPLEDVLNFEKLKKSIRWRKVD
jgi:hypothetical protein